MKRSQIPAHVPTPKTEFEQHLARVGLNVGGDLFSDTLHVFTRDGTRIPITKEVLECGGGDYSALVKELARLGGRLVNSTPRRTVDMLTIDDFEREILEVCKRHDKRLYGQAHGFGYETSLEIIDGFSGQSEELANAVKNYKEG